MKRKIKEIKKGKTEGMTLVETVVALAILGTITVVFLGGIMGTTRAASISDAQTTAYSLAQSQMEWAHNLTYVHEASQYTPSPIPDNPNYMNFSANISAFPLNAPDDGIQKILVTVKLGGKTLATLESYKVDR